MSKKHTPEPTGAPILNARNNPLSCGCGIKGTMDTDVTFYKIFTHDHRSPLCGGEPVWNGSVPFELPVVRLDTGPAGCAAGWNFVDDLAAGFRIAGLWPMGRPSLVTIIEPAADRVQRGSKWRSSGGRLARLATEDEIFAGIQTLSQVFVGFELEMAEEQLAWRGGSPWLDTTRKLNRR